MQIYRKRNRSDSNVNPREKDSDLRETELVLKLKKEELFDQHILLPHAELNKVVYDSVNAFVGKYRGGKMSLSICTDPVSPVVENLFREVYRAHYNDELQKIARFIKRHTIRGIILIIVSILAFLISNQLANVAPDKTVLSYIIGNISVFCLWEVGYTQFATRDVVMEKRRITRALNATISFHEQRFRNILSESI